jgi:hypothetical protein
MLSSSIFHTHTVRRRQFYSPRFMFSYACILILLFLCVYVLYSCRILFLAAKLCGVSSCRVYRGGSNHDDGSLLLVSLYFLRH